MINASTPITINSHVVKNRITFAPTVKFWAGKDGLVTDWFVKHYEDRARYNCGLICVEATCVAEDGRLSPTQLGLWNDEQIEGHRKLTDACHAFGSTMLVQIHHGGRQTHPECGPSKGPSAVEGRRGLCEALTLEEIHVIEKQFVDAAVRAKKAGYDGIQLHACHGYLFNQFISLSTNKRTDEYGCRSIEDRARLGANVIRGIREVCGPDFIISARTVGFEPTIEDGIAVCEEYVKAGCDYLQISNGIGPEIREPHDESLPYNDIAEQGVLIHEHFKGRVPVSLVNSIYEPAQVEYLLNHELVDTVDFARALLADPRFADACVNGTSYIRCSECRVCLWSPMMKHHCPAVAKRCQEDPNCPDYRPDTREE